MFFKQEMPEMDDFARNKNFGCSGKILKNFNILRKRIHFVEREISSNAKCSSLIYF